jgi:hypothetical protein
MKPRDLAVAAGMKDYGAVSTAIRGFKRELPKRILQREQWKRISQ